MQNPPKAARKLSTAHRFTRVDFQKIEGTGKNALDFHIAFQLGRTIEVAPATECFVLSRDKGFDPLLSHLNKNGLKCQRINSLDELKVRSVAVQPECDLIKEVNEMNRAVGVEVEDEQRVCGVKVPDQKQLAADVSKNWQAAYLGAVNAVGKPPAIPQVSWNDLKAQVCAVTAVPMVCP